MKLTGLLFMVLCTTSTLVPAQQTEAGGTAATIRALEHEWVVGQSHNDNRVLDLIFDNALVYAEYGKLVSKGEYLSRIKRVSSQSDTIGMEPMTVHTFGNTAIVVGTYREKEVKGGQTTVRHWRYIDTWVYKKSGWVLVAAGAAPSSK
jgi:hypothetical protein